jgi:bis(5'-nucleosyl)-tetraphosphatase (symmetrical)
MLKRTIIIGDVHGCLVELKELLSKLNYNPLEDRIILAGDYVDRGPNSSGVVKYARENKLEGVLGNHDEKLIRYRKHKKKLAENPNYKIPMRQLSGEKLAVFEALSDEDFAYLESLPTYIELENNWIVAHAGLEPGKTLPEQDPGKLTHIRFVNPETLKTVSLDDNYEAPEGSVYWTDLYKGPYSVIYGHNVHQLDAPEIREVAPGIKTIGIDTGCCFGGNLTAFILPTEEFVSVKAKENYKLRVGVRKQ